VSLRRTALITAERHLNVPRALIETQRGRLVLADSRLLAVLRRSLAGSGSRLAARAVSAASLQAVLRERRTYLAGLDGRLEAGNPLGLLARGYALVRDMEGRPVTRAAGLRAGTPLGLRFADGEKRVRVEPEA